MPLYLYQAINKKGVRSSGFLKAERERDLAWQLKKDGLTPIKIELRGVKEGKSFFSFSFGSVPLVEKLMFTRHLGVMIKGGVSLPEAISVLAGQAESAVFSKVLKEVLESVKKGIPLHEALAMHPKVFSKIFISMVEIGEALGNLEEALNLLAREMKKEHELRSKIKGAMMYPMVVFFAMIVIGMIMMVVVIPKLTKIFTDLDVELPATTQFIVNVSDFLRNHTLLFIFGFLAFIFLMRLVIKSRLGGRLVDWLILKTPFIKGIATEINSAQFCRSLSSMLAGGVPIVRALEIISSSVNNVFYQEAIKKASQEVRKGVALNSVLAENSGIFPTLVTQMVRVGEETGMSADILKQLAEFYEEEVDTITKSLSSIMEPVLMIVMGAAVGFFAISMLQPMYSIMNEVG